MAKTKETKLRKPWHGAQRFDGRLRIPPDVVMLCKLMNTSPSEILQGFLNCLAVEKDQKNPDAAKQATIDFFIHYGFGKNYYSEEDIRKMFTELRRVNDLWPEESATSKFIDHHAYWRGKYWKHWFKKWYWKIRRRKNDVAN